MTPRKIIIDTDPGQDDAVAILLALASPGGTRRAGDRGGGGQRAAAADPENARMVCELAGRPDVRVFAGCDRPMSRALVTAEYVHGKTGLDGPVLPDPTMPLQEQARRRLHHRDAAARAAGTVTLCPLGPLTNIATAFRRAPDIVGRVQEVVLMGGAYFEVGNVTPAAEFNIYVDPEAADIVFRSAWPSPSCRSTSRTRR
jgi:purine nucleosidase